MVEIYAFITKKDLKEKTTTAAHRYGVLRDRAN
jgi:hypothetical protein